jgi:hypothetical protein
MEVVMTYESRLLAGILLIVLPTVMIGGVSILSRRGYISGGERRKAEKTRQILMSRDQIWLVIAILLVLFAVTRYLVRENPPPICADDPAAPACQR